MSRPRIPEHEAIRAYQAIHALNHEKREITKQQSDYKGLVKEYLEENPKGFYVDLEDARGSSHLYHIFRETVTRVNFDRASLRMELVKKLEAAGETAFHVPQVLTSSYLSRMVERGYLTPEDIEGYEDLMESTPLKKKKVKGGRASLTPEETKQEEGQMELPIGADATLTVSRGGKTEVHRPKVTKYDAEGNAEVVQEASVEIHEEDADRPGGNWAV